MNSSLFFLLISQLWVMTAFLLVGQGVVAEISLGLGVVWLIAAVLLRA